MASRSTTRCYYLAWKWQGKQKDPVFHGVFALWEFHTDGLRYPLVGGVDKCPAGGFALSVDNACNGADSPQVGCTLCWAAFYLTVAFIATSKSFSV